MSGTADTDLLPAGRGIWLATPWNYSSLRSLWLRPDGNGQLIYGYGQTFYAHILCRWQIPASGVLRLHYLESPAFGHRFTGYTPGPDSIRELQYTLTPGDVAGSDDIVARPFRFLWTLKLSEQPWPLEVQLPYEVPRIFYGHESNATEGDG